MLKVWNRRRLYSHAHRQNNIITTSYFNAKMSWKDLWFPGSELRRERERSSCGPSSNNSAVKGHLIEASQHPSPTSKSRLQGRQQLLVVTWRLSFLYVGDCTLKSGFQVHRQIYDTQCRIECTFICVHKNVRFWSRNSAERLLAQLVKLRTTISNFSSLHVIFEGSIGNLQCIYDLGTSREHWIAWNNALSNFPSICD